MGEAPRKRLDSWKVIAEHLGRNVRTVTRWSEERGLPVHRVPGGKRGTVFAFADELDAWLLSQNNKDSDSDSVQQKTGTSETGEKELGAIEEGRAEDRPLPEDRRVEVEPVQKSVPERRWRGWRWIAVAGIVLFTMGALFAGLRPASKASAQPFGVKIEGDSIEAKDAGGRTLWTYKFPQPLWESFLAGLRSRNEWARIADFYGDGKKEVATIAPLVVGPNPDDNVQTEVDFFSSTGGLVWKYRPNKTFQFGTHELKNPWVVLDLFVSNAGGETSLWATSAHHLWSNSFVVQLDPRTGYEKMRFVNTGVLYVLHEVKTETGTYLLAGGFNNEWDSGSLAIVNENRPFAASPQTPGTRHECVSCPPGAPDYYFVFPRTEINKISGVSEDSVIILRMTDEGIEITKEERKNAGDETTIYLLSAQPPFSVISLRYGSGYDMTHRAWSAAGKFSHTLEQCPERMHPQPVRLWTPKQGWTEIPVKAAKANQ